MVRFLIISARLPVNSIAKLSDRTLLLRVNVLSWTRSRKKKMRMMNAEPVSMRKLAAASCWTSVPVDAPALRSSAA
jgi:hypothetical protein